jgi:peptidoglycan/LPS O-acetylase OafA/YrhL
MGKSSMPVRPMAALAICVLALAAAGGAINWQEAVARLTYTQVRTCVALLPLGLAMPAEHNNDRGSSPRWTRPAPAM